MIEIRVETPQDYGAIRGLIVTVFRETFGSGEDEAMLVEQLRQAEGYDASLSLVAIDRDMIVGHVLFSRVTITSPGGATDALALAPLGVLKPCRRQGIGSRLVTAGLDHGRALGYRAVFVRGGPKYYGRFGFTPASTKGLAMPFATVSDPDHMVLELTVGGLGGLSGSVEYPPPWEAFK